MEEIPRSRKFMSIDSLYYEQERLNTFINWPVSFLSPNDLAANGFYYLRTKDHCACAFCRGIIGAWEEGDTPLGEHKKHFPKCPFINGGPTPNVPLDQGNLLAQIHYNSAIATDSGSGEESTTQGTQDQGEDVCGIREFPKSSGQLVRVTKNGVGTMNVPLSELGLKFHQSPQRPDYMNPENRRESFMKWPGVDIPVDKLVDAGFYYIGLSDHVRCYHCGNGLRNWEDGDDPWIEHARWYPKCEFVLLKKGTKFIEKVHQARPPYRHSPPNEPSTYYSEGTRSRRTFELTTEALEKLMELEVVKTLLELGFPKDAVSLALKYKIQESGVPFLLMHEAIDKTVQVLNEVDCGDEWRLKAQDAKRWLDRLNREREEPIIQHSNLPILPRPVITQVATMDVDNNEDTNGEDVAGNFRSQSNGNEISTNVESQEQTIEVEMESVDETEVPGPLAEHVQENIAELSHHRSDSPQEGSIVEQQSTTPNDASTVNETQSELQERSTVVVYDSQPASTSGESGSSSPKSEEITDPLKEADVIMKTAAKVLAKDPLSSSNSSVSENEEERRRKLMQELMSDESDAKDNRTCRVCMNGDSEVVFLPCSHMIACASCALALKMCPICRGRIIYTLRPYMS